MSEHYLRTLDETILYIQYLIKSGGAVEQPEVGKALSGLLQNRDALANYFFAYVKGGSWNGIVTLDSQRLLASSNYLRLFR